LRQAINIIHRELQGAPCYLQVRLRHPPEVYHESVPDERIQILRDAEAALVLQTMEAQATLHAGRFEPHILQTCLTPHAHTSSDPDRRSMSKASALCNS